MHMSLYNLGGAVLTLFIDSDILIGDRKLLEEKWTGENKKRIQILL